MRVAVYARVSTERQEQQGTIASQLDALRRYAREQGHEVVETYVCIDDGYSGTCVPSRCRARATSSLRRCRD